MTRVALIGSGGQLGHDLQRHLAAAGAFDVRSFDRLALDCTNRSQVRDQLIDAAPDVVINCAAYVRVDAAETEAEEAFRVNAIGALYVAQACVELGAVCVQISTDFVFDGKKGMAYTEKDAPRPINVYGVSKYAGELLVQLTTPQHLIVRTAGLFGATQSRTKRNFVDVILDKAMRGEPMEIANDIRTSPTLASDLAVTIIALLRAGARGVVHAANAGDCSWYEFARYIASGYPQVRITPISSSARQARRPPNSALAGVRLHDEFGVDMRRWQEALADHLQMRSLEGHQI